MLESKGVWAFIPNRIFFILPLKKILLGSKSQATFDSIILYLITIIGLANGAILNPTSNSPIGSISGLEDLLAIFMNPSSGGLNGLLDMINIGGMGDMLTILQDLLGTSIKPRQQRSDVFNNVPISNLPDFASLLDLGQAGSVGELFEMMNAHAGFINGNFSGKNQETLLTLLKLAYVQAYRSF